MILLGIFFPYCKSSLRSVVPPQLFIVVHPPFCLISVCLRDAAPSLWQWSSICSEGHRLWRPPSPPAPPPWPWLPLQLSSPPLRQTLPAPTTQRSTRMTCLKKSKANSWTKLIKSHVSSPAPLSQYLLRLKMLFTWQKVTVQSQFSLCCSETDSASVGSDCHRRGGRIAHPHLLLLHNQKMLLQKEEEQEREEGQGRLQHEEHAGWRGMMPRAYMLKRQSNWMFWEMFCLFSSNMLPSIIY